VPDNGFLPASMLLPQRGGDLSKTEPDGFPFTASAIHSTSGDSARKAAIPIDFNPSRSE
jgi:hypothetical protein